MNKEELIKFLKENLKININYTLGISDGEGYKIHVELLLNDEVIDKSSEYLPIDF